MANATAVRNSGFSNPGEATTFTAARRSWNVRHRQQMAVKITRALFFIDRWDVLAEINYLTLDAGFRNVFDHDATLSVVEESLDAGRDPLFGQRTVYFAALFV